MNKIYVIIKIFFKQLVQNKIFHFVIMSGIVFGIISILLNEVSYGASEKIIKSFSLGFCSILVNFLSIYFGTSIFLGENMKHSVSLLCTKPISRNKIILGIILAFALCLSISLMIIIPEFIFIFNLFGVSVTSIFYFSLLGIFFEGIILFLFTIIFRFFTNPLITVMITISYYIFIHGAESLINLGIVSRYILLKEGIVIFSKILPDLTYFNLKDMNIITNDAILASVCYFIISTCILTIFGMFLFNNRDLE